MAGLSAMAINTAPILGGVLLAAAAGQVRSVHRVIRSTATVVDE